MSSELRQALFVSLAGMMFGAAVAITIPVQVVGLIGLVAVIAILALAVWQKVTNK